MHSERETQILRDTHTLRTRNTHTERDTHTEWIQKMWYIYTMEYHSAIRNNDLMKFLGKRVELENIILSEVTQSQKNTHGVHSLISGYWPRDLEYPRYNSQTT